MIKRLSGTAAGKIVKKNYENWGREEKRANQTSHRYNRLPLLPSDPGGVQQELVVLACRAQRYSNIVDLKP
jgi:hypothetical protein